MFSEKTANQIVPMLTRSPFSAIPKDWNISYVPSVWKQAFVPPMYKAGEKTDPKNYCPISLT